MALSVTGLAGGAAAAVLTGQTVGPAVMMFCGAVGMVVVLTWDRWR